MKAILLLLVCHTLCQAEDFHLEYYTDLTLNCGETEYNFTNTNPATKYWLLPNGDFMTETVPENKRIAIGADMSNFTLTITKLDDPDFGWYYCIIVWTDHSIDRIRHGVNVDGPFYGDLLDKYRHNAMIGGIAAGSLFVLLAGSCIIWHCRYRGRDDRSKVVDDLDKAIEGFDVNAYDNMAADVDGTKSEKLNSNIQDDQM